MDCFLLASQSMLLDLTCVLRKIQTKQVKLLFALLES